MGRRRLTGVAAATLGAFVGRNNDLDGYWALGQLRAECTARRVARLRLDLVGGTAPEGEVASRVAASFREVLARQLAQHGLAGLPLRSAWVLLDFAPPPTVAVDLLGSYGDLFSCAVEIEDDRGVRYVRGTAGRCAPHDPSRERRSARP